MKSNFTAIETKNYSGSQNFKNPECICTYIYCIHTHTHTYTHEQTVQHARDIMPSCI